MAIRISLTATVLLAALVAPAGAHALLRDASPPAGSTVQPPSQVAIDYSEALEPHFSTLVVTDAAGHRVDNGDAHVAPDNGKRFIVGLKRLSPGVYKVDWHATSVDTHKTQGSYEFTVAP